MQISQDMSLKTIYQPIAGELAIVKDNLLGHLRDGFELIRGIGFEQTVVGGKHIRPALTLLAGMSINADKGPFLIDVAVASEMTHFASLIHDDVVDGARMRRGAESVNARWHDKVAVLLGDYIISKAMYMLSEYRNSNVIRTIMSAVRDMSEGELHQITVRSDGIISEDDYYSIIRHKTSSLMGAVCTMPAQVLGASTDTVDAMNNFGHNFGMAFQIVDDLLDFRADEEQLGKPIFCDIRDGKATLPTLCLLKRLDENGADRIRRMLDERRLTDGDKAWLSDIILEFSVDEQCLEIACEFTSRAKRAIDVIPDSEYRKSMLDLCDYIVTRDK
jgi:octaprenyl-diphosphate synthase